MQLERREADPFTVDQSRSAKSAGIAGAVVATDLANPARRKVRTTQQKL